MAVPFTPRAPLRFRHGRNEALLGADFADQAAQDEQLRWWHNRALHDCYGIVDGLRVTISDEHDFATVGPGLAYDRHGRELILDVEVRLAAPAEPDEAWLVLSYRQGRRPALSWSAAAPTVGVPLTRGVGEQRVTARADRLVVPYVRHGATTPGSNRWRPWFEPLGNFPRIVGLEQRVDTSASGFTAVPCYFVQYFGPLWSKAVPRPLVVPFDHVVEPAADGFTYRLLVPELLQVSIPDPESFEATIAPIFSAIAEIAALAWIGVQPAPGEPVHGELPAKEPAPQQPQPEPEPVIS
jgi:hypothetical protein